MIHYIDIIILIVLIIFIISIIYDIYQYYTNTNNKETKIEKFSHSNQHNDFKDTIDELNSNFIITFPGEPKVKIYKVPTIDDTLILDIYKITRPIINFINIKQGYNFIIGNIIYIVIKEYDIGTVYNMELVLIDNVGPITLIIILEIILMNNEFTHINYIYIKNNIKNKENHNLLNNIGKITTIKTLKETLLPIKY